MEGKELEKHLDSVFEREEYAKKQFWDDRFKQYPSTFIILNLGVTDSSTGTPTGGKSNLIFKKCVPSVNSNSNKF